MKKLLLLFVALFAIQASAQSLVGTWKYGEWKVNHWSDGSVYVYNVNCNIVNSNSTIAPHLTIQMEKRGFWIRLDNDTPFSYDETGKRNFVNFDFIIDDTPRMNGYGDIVGVVDSEATRVYLRKRDGYVSLEEVAKGMRAGRDIFIRVEGAKAHVYKYSANGFTAAWNKGKSIILSNKNPFEGTNNTKNPFQR